MKLTPLDIRKQSFKKVMRGFDPTEVSNFLEMVAKEFEELVRENSGLVERVHGLDEQIEDYRKMQKALQETMMTAQQATEGMKSSAKSEAESLIREAQIKAEKVLQDARERLISLQRDISDLKHQKKTYLVKFHSLLQAQLKMLDEIEETKHEEEKDLFSEIDETKVIETGLDEDF